MISFKSVLTNDWIRMLAHKSRIVLFLFLTTGAVAAAVFFNTKAEIAGNVAFVSQGNQEVYSNAYLNVTQLEAAPPLSDLVSGRYDALVVDKGNGEYDVQTIKNDEFKHRITNVLSNPSEYHVDMAGHRKVGTNIVGFLTMFIMMQGVTLMILFAEDKEQGQIRRIAGSPVSFTGYLCAHSLFTFLFMLIPTMLILQLVRFVLGVDVGFGFWEYLMLISMICAFATSFALLINAFINKSDSANMMGSAIAVLSSVLAGSFYSFDKGNGLLEALIKILPQKSYLMLAGGLEGGSDMRALLPHFIYLSGAILVFFLVAVIKTKKDYIQKR